MDVSDQERATTAEPERGPRARTARLMLESAVRLMQRGMIPSVTQVAEEARVSRATAYRYFPSQAALVQAVVDEALGPILDWHSDSPDVAHRVEDLFSSSLPRMRAFEATFRATLKHALDDWAARQVDPSIGPPQFKRGHRRELLSEVVAPWRDTLGADGADRLAKALSLAFGVEAFVVLKDIWDCSDEETEAVATWASRALVAAAAAEAAGLAKGRSNSAGGPDLVRPK